MPAAFRPQCHHDCIGKRIPGVDETGRGRDPTGGRPSRVKPFNLTELSAHGGVDTLEPLLSDPLSGLWDREAPPRLTPAAGLPR
jgi:hypothetical protein